MRCALVSYWCDIDAIINELAQYDFVFACEQAAYDLLQKGVCLEKIISDFDTVSSDKIHTLATNMTILPTQKDETDTVALFHYILEQFPDASITLYNEFSDRIDHALALFSLFQRKPSLIIQTPATQISCLAAGKHILSPLKNYQYISFLALDTVTNIELIHFRYPLKKAALAIFSDLTVSNEFIAEQPATVNFDSGRLLVIYSRDIRL